MRIVEWIDDGGYKHLSMVRDNDPDHMARSGIPLDPPDISVLDWNGIVRDLHNALVERRLSSMQEVNENPNAVIASIVSVLKKPVLGLYKQQATAAKRGGQ